LTESAGKDPATQPLPLQAARRGRWGAHTQAPSPKDSNALVRVRDRATGKALKGADRQTNRFSAHYSKLIINDKYIRRFNKLAAVHQ